MLKLGVISDDLTGATKVASLLETAGVRCPLVTSASALRRLKGDERAVVIGRQFLAIPAEEAVADSTQAAEALLNLNTQQLYYKYSALFSSTDQGNIGPVAEALSRLTNSDCVFFCPARPARNATVYQGRLFLGRNMLHETPRRFDPLTPMTNSNLVEVLQSQTGVQVGLLPFNVLRKSIPDIQAFLKQEKEQGKGFFIVDAIEDGDLTRLAELSEDLSFTTGSDDYPVAIANKWDEPIDQDAGKSLLPPAPGYTALISGSCTPKSNRQLAEFERQYPVFHIDLREHTDLDSLITHVHSWAGEHLSGGPIALATTTDTEHVKLVQTRYGKQASSSLVDELTSRIAQVLFEVGTRKFIVAGGETSGRVLDALGVQKLDVAIHDELLGGYCHANEGGPISFVLKAGATGEENFYELALARLKEADTQHG